MKSERALRLAVAHLDVGASYVGEVLRDLARPWRAPVGLVEVFGNVDADARYTESRLSPVGAMALASEQGQLAALPIGIMNGTVYQGGYRPPFGPQRVIAALSAVLTDTELADDALLGLLGPPVFPHGCDIVGDIGALLTGQGVELRLYPAAEVSADGATIELSRFPSELWAAPGVQLLRQHTGTADQAKRRRNIERLPITSVDDISAGTVDHSHERVRLKLEDGADPDPILALLRADPAEDPFRFWAPHPIRAPTSESTSASPSHPCCANGSTGIAVPTWPTASTPSPKRSRPRPNPPKGRRPREPRLSAQRSPAASPIRRLRTLDLPRLSSHL